MMVFIIIFIAVFGAAIGSFVNVLIDRIPRGESIFISRSYCEKCKRHLDWFELIPIFSYIFLRGKCRKCHTKIPFRILVVEMVTPALFLLTVLMYFLQKGEVILTILPFYFLIEALLVAIFFIDIAHMIIPDSLLIVLVLGILAMHMLFSPAHILPSVITGIGAAVFFFILFAVTRGRGMGFGDVKFAFVIGLFLGLIGTIIALYTAFLTGAAFSIILIIRKKKKFRGSTIPFGPFLVVGVFTAFLFGAYLSRFIPL